ncbi:TonB-dependent receptor [Flavihumibacter rivuli]|uniref:SusC/RagA family TonB-linked outer membrane protein n=1 Tax=Flavihumibacter rivuli TaxID=2838156 RepID=UPI001BDE4394|nr:TonB-dependent receptor [Flavihumibacter rivuli]ULQ55289.1 TonB-dependent receptor [Flavihumibacter rivuli]
MSLKRLLLTIALPLLLLTMQQGVFAQVRTISGKVTDKDGTPLSGVSVIVKGTRAGVSTTADGSFSIQVPDNNAVLVFSSVGFTRQEMKVGEKNTITLTMQNDQSQMGEVVVIGYGTQRKREVTGSIAKVSSDKINSIPAPSFEAALQGRAAGVQVVQGSGLAGSGSVVRVRGINSISAGGDPLYVVDGIPITQDPFLRGNSGAMNQNPLASINPSDIESVEVLKDAAAAGIYGSRGANGVILVTTKRGKSGKPSFNYNNRIGISTYANRPKFANNEEWLALRQEAWQNDGNSGLAPLPAGITWDKAAQTNTDWWDLLTRDGFINEHNLSMNTGGKKMKAYVGATYSDNQSYIMGNSFTRYGLRVNLDYKFSDKFKAALTSGWNRGVNKRVPAAWSGGLGDAMSTALPIYPVYKEDGSYWLDGANPYARMVENTWINRDDRLLGGLVLEYTPIKNLTIKANGNIDYMIGMEDRFESAKIRNSTSGLGFARRSPIWTTNLNANLTANYRWDMNTDNSFNFLVGTEVQESYSKSYNTDFGRELNEPYYKNKSVWQDTRDSFAKNNLMDTTEFNAFTFNSFFGRINYSYKNKLFLQFTARIDGSSRFGSNNKYGFFPSAAIGYTLTEDEYFKNIDWLNFLKVRASAGIMGNSNIPAGRYYTAYNGGSPYVGGQTYYLDRIGNPDLRWEKIFNFDAGIEFAVLNNRVTGELSYYNRSTTDVLLDAGLSPSTGFNNGWRNLDNSLIVNEGVELTLNAKIIKNKDFEWSVGGNISKNYNEVKDLGNLSADAISGGTNDTRIAVGYPVGTNYLVRFHGVDENDGLPIWVDINGKLTKTFSLNNRVPVGSVIPDYVGGFNTFFAYKGFELSGLFTYTIGGNIYDGSAKRQLGIVTDWNIRTDIADRWRNPGDVATFPRLTMRPDTYYGLSSEWQYNSTLFLYDASFLRMRELTLAYNLPATLLSRIKINRARFFVTGMNLLTWSKYPGGDPEIARDFENPQDRNLSPNVTYLTPPQQKSVTFGLNITF